MRHYIFAVLGTAVLTAAVASPSGHGQEVSSTGQIVGRVRFTGKLPPAKLIMVSDGTTIQHRDLVVDSKDRGLRYVVAVLEDAPKQPPLRGAKPVLVDQIGWVFQPRVVAVQHGRPVRFDNNDQVNHSVMAASLVPSDQFNAIAGPNEPIVHTFALQKRPVMIGCSLHPWMRAWVYVFAHPWFAVTDPHGRFTIRNVPPGDYTLSLVHPDTNLREKRRVTVAAGRTVDVAIDWSQLP